MARASVVPEILERLEPHLEALEIAWMEQADGDRTPTLPVTNDGKVNVRHLVRNAGLRQTQEQHFYNKPELAALVNALARAQGIKPIGSRMLEAAEDDAARARIAKVSGDNSDLRRALAEREAVIEGLRQENGRLRAQLGLLEETGAAMRKGGIG